MSDIVQVNEKTIDTAIEKYSISESNHLIESSFELDKYQLKLISLLSAFVKKEDEDFKVYKFPASWLLNYLWLWKWKHQVLKQVLTDLMKKVFVWKYYSEEYNDIREWLVHWVSTADYPVNWEWIIEISIHPRMKYLLLLNNDSSKWNFTTYMLSNIASFKSAYSNRIYRLLKKDLEKWRKYKINKVVYKYEELRKIFKLEKEYSRYYDFRKRIIITSQKELELLSDIRFEFEEIRLWKSVDSIEFTIYDNSKEDSKNIEEINNFVENVDLHKELYKFWFTPREISALFTKYWDKAIKYSIDYMLWLKTYKTIENKKQYYKKVVQDKLYTQKVVEKKIEEKRALSKKEEKSKLEEDKNQQIAFKMVEEMDYNKIISNFSKEEFQKVKNDFFNTKIKWKWLEKVWKWDVDSISFKAGFREYIIEKYS